MFHLFCCEIFANMIWFHALYQSHCIQFCIPPISPPDRYLMDDTHHPFNPSQNKFLSDDVSKWYLFRSKKLSMIYLSSEGEEYALFDASTEVLGCQISRKFKCDSSGSHTSRANLGDVHSRVWNYPSFTSIRIPNSFFLSIRISGYLPTNVSSVFQMSLLEIIG